MTIVIMGPQGSGKSTQAKLLAEKMGFLYVSMGDIFRELAKQDTKDGREMDHYIRTGEQAPNELATKALLAWLKRQGEVKDIVTDGYPRNLENVRDLKEQVIPLYGPLKKVIYIDTTKQECLKRLAKRAEIEHRIDETPEAISMRLKLYFEKTVPVLEYYRDGNLLTEIAGDRDIEEIREDILEHVTIDH